MNGHRTTSRILGAAGAALLASVLLVPAAVAGPGHGHHGPPAHARHGAHGHHDRHDGPQRHHRRHVSPAPRYGYDYRVAPAPRRGFVVPTRIVRPARYDSYYHGDVWYGPHRHSHRVYYFPVLVEGRWVPRAHFYCGDRAFDAVHAEFHGPRFSIRLSF